MSSYSSRIAYLGSQRPQFIARRGVWTTLRAMVSARRTRRLLAAMDDRTLADIGIGRGDAVTEAARPLWDIDPI